MSSSAPSSSSSSPAPASAAPTPPTPSYALVGSYDTVQVLSPTLTVDVVYCTIATQPSSAIVSRTVNRSVFDQGQAGVQLTNFADAVEQILSDTRVIAATGDQSIDLSGLLADFVVFTVQYVDPVLAPNGATAEASVGVDQLDFSDVTIGPTLLQGVLAIIDQTYTNLQAAASG